MATPVHRQLQLLLLPLEMLFTCGKPAIKALFNVLAPVCVLAVPKEKTQDDSNLMYIYIGTSIFSVLMVIVGMGLILYRRRKQAHFNEIPTVSRMSCF